MTVDTEKEFGAYVVAGTFLGEVTAFALGDGSVRTVGAGIDQADALHDGAILVAIPSLDGKALITAGDDGTVAVTDARGKSETLATRPGKWIDQIAAGPNGSVAFATGRKVEVRFGDGREKVLDLPRAAGGLAFSPKGFRLAVARYNGATLWWPGTEAEPTGLEWDGAHIAASFSPDGKYLVTAMQDNQLHGWRLADGKDMRMSGYPSKPRSLSWSVKGRFLATSGANAAVLWPFHHKDGPQGKQPIQLGPREDLVTRVACDPRKERVAIGYRDGTVVVVGFDGSAEPAYHHKAEGPVSALSWDKSGRRLVLGTETGSATVAEIADA
ncbi:MAG: WD40 repeat domain-containing protein [Hyphomicrobiales bacterium]|nr:WD40 repeat domain-containing protein [Hyphomicrobiales bacterium]